MRMISCTWLYWAATVRDCAGLYCTCVFCKVQCHCIFYGPGIRYSDIFSVPCISSEYSDIFWHISAVDTVTYFGGNHGSRVWKSLKLKKVYFLHTRTSWDKYMFNGIPELKILDTSELVRLRRKIFWAKYTLCTVTLIKQNSLILRPEIIIKEFGRVIYILDPLPLEFSYLGEQSSFILILLTRGEIRFQSRKPDFLSSQCLQEGPKWLW